jgi:dTDP-4-dehydrorhamnose 3,5-epimerase
MIDGVVIRDLAVHADERGRFIETFRKEWVVGGREMIQANRADRQAGCIVGLHFHRFQADWWYVVLGTARVVLHDLRIGSPTDGETMSFDLAADEPRGVYIPPGVAHGFASLTDVTLTYLVDGYYDPADELGVAWDDPDIGADWGVTDPVLSGRDSALPRRSAIDRPHAP